MRTPQCPQEACSRSSHDLKRYDEIWESAFSHSLTHKSPNENKKKSNFFIFFQQHFQPAFLGILTKMPAAIQFQTSARRRFSKTFAHLPSLFASLLEQHEQASLSGSHHPSRQNLAEMRHFSAIAQTLTKFDSHSVQIKFK